MEVLTRPSRQNSGRLGRYGETIYAIADPKDAAKQIIGSLPRPGGGKRSGPMPVQARAGIGVGIGAWLTKAAGLVLYPDMEVLWSWRVGRFLAPRLRPSDLVITCARPESVGLVGSIAVAKGAWWWFDLADSWCWEGIRHKAHGLPPWRIRKEKRLERQWIARAHGISTVNAKLAAYFQSLRPCGPVHIYPNVVPRELAGRRAPHVPIRQSGDEFNILYFGRLKASDSERDLSQLAHIVASRKPDQAAPNFIFCGEFVAADHEEMQKLKRYGARVTVYPLIPREQLPCLVAEQNVKAMLVVNSPHSTASTSKLFDALGLGMPTLLLARADSEAARLVEELRAGVVVTPPGSQPLSWMELCARLEGLGQNEQRLPPKCDGEHQAGLLVEAICMAI